MVFGKGAGLLGSVVSEEEASWWLRWVGSMESRDVKGVAGEWPGLGGGTGKMERA